MTDPIKFSIIGVVSLAAACASLDVEPIKPGPQSGLKYDLPMTQFQIDISRRATACLSKDGKNDLTPGGRLIIGNEAKVKAITVSDPDRIYAIYPDSLSTVLNKASLSVEYHSGTRRLKSINATVEDQAGPAIISAIKTAAGLGSLPAGTGSFSQMKCKSGLEKEIKKARDQKLKMKQATRELEAANLKVTNLKAQIASNASPDLLENLTKALIEQKAKASVLVGEQKKYADLSEPSVIKHSQITWPVNADEFEFEKAEKPKGEKDPEKTETPEGEKNPEKTETPEGEKDPEKTETPESKHKFNLTREQLKKLLGNVSLSESDLADINDKLALAIFIVNQEKYARKVSDNSKPITVTPTEEPSTTNGVFYREPAKGRLIIKPKTGSSNKIVHNKVYEISQLGFVDVIPIRSKIFESVEFSAEFDKKGRLVKSGYKQTSAPVTSATPIAETLGGLKRARQAQRDADLAAEIARLENEKKLQELKDPPDPGEVDLVDTIISELEAEKALNAIE